VPRASFQTKLFLTALAAAVLALVVAGVLFSMMMQRETNLRIEQTLRSEAQLAAELLMKRVGDLCLLPPESAPARAFSWRPLRPVAHLLLLPRSGESDGNSR